MSIDLYREELREFEENGYVFVPGLLTPEETTLLLTTAREDHEMRSHAFDVNDTAGRKTRLSLWNHPGDDIFGMVSRSRGCTNRWESPWNWMAVPNARSNGR